MRTIVIILAVLLSSATSGFAGPYSLRDGFYWLEGVPHTRTLVTCRRNGCRVRRYEYVRALTYQNPGWRSLVVQLKEKQLLSELELLKSQAESKEFITTIKALNLEGYVAGSVQLQGSMNFGQYGNGYFPNAEQAAVLGQSPYQTTQYRKVTDIYGLDPNVMIQQRRDAQKASTELTAKIDDGTVTVLSQLAENDKQYRSGVQRIEELRAKIELMKSVDRTDIHTNETTTMSLPTPPGHLSESVEGFKNLVEQKCYSCHGGDKVEKGDSGLFPDGLDFTVGIFNSEQKMEILRRVTNDTMPPENSLSLEEKTLALSWVHSKEGE